MPEEVHRSGSGQDKEATDDQVVKDDAYYAEVRGALGTGTPSVLFGTSSRAIARAIDRARQGNGPLSPSSAGRSLGQRRAPQPERFIHIDSDARDLDHIVRALEDLPEDVREQARVVLDVPEGQSFAKKVADLTEDAAVDLYGSQARVKYLRFLSQYPVLSYVFEMSSFLSRGSRPNAERLAALARAGYGATVNLCAEIFDGDAPAIQKAGLPGSLKTLHIPIADGTPPDLDQVAELLRYLADPKTGRVYMHCEAGKARTGVMAACCRMALMGWSLDDALLEAKNFGCSIPMQLDFIGDFGQQLARGDLEAAGYPREPLGSHILTAAERDATLAKVAAAEKGRP